MTRVTASTCRAIRESVEPNTPLDGVVDEFDLPRSDITYHLYGECDHQVSVEPLPRPGKPIPAEDCSEIRQLAADGVHPRAIADRTGHSWDAVVNHATGECGHEGTGPTTPKADLYDRHPLSADDCAQLRRDFVEASDVLDLAEDVVWSYHTVLHHVNGECDHEDVDVAPREKQDRGDEVSAAECRRLRETYREDASVTFTDLASTFDRTRSTVEKHVQFGCAHPPSEDIQELLRSAGFADVLDYPEDVDPPTEAAAADGSSPEVGVESEKAGTVTGDTEVPETEDQDPEDAETGTEETATATPADPVGETPADSDRVAPTAESATSGGSPGASDTAESPNNGETTSTGTGYEVNAIILAIAESRAGDPETGVDSLGSLVEDAVKELLKAVTDGTVEEPLTATEGRTRFVDLTIKGSPRAMMDAVVDSTDTGFASGDEFVETALYYRFDLDPADADRTVSLPWDVVMGLKELSSREESEAPVDIEGLTVGILREQLADRL